MRGATNERRSTLFGLPDLKLEHTSGEPAQHEEGFAWRLSRVSSLPAERKNGWVVARMLDEYAQERQIADACNLTVFHERMREAGLASILDPKSAPRARCAALKTTGMDNASLLDE